MGGDVSKDGPRSLNLSAVWHLQAHPAQVVATLPSRWARGFTLAQTGPPPSGNLTVDRFCNQAQGLKEGGLPWNKWYLKAAVQAHEEVHAAHCESDLEAVVTQRNIVDRVEQLGVANVPNKTLEQAVTELKTSEEFNALRSETFEKWTAKWLEGCDSDHGPDGEGPAYDAGDAVANEMRNTICTYAAGQLWDMGRVRLSTALLFPKQSTPD